jgi:hypothetical protein
MDLRIGTWNMRTVYKAGNLRAPTQLDSYRLHIVAIQETKWMGINVWDSKTHTILQSGKQNGKREFGVAFIVDEVTKRNIMAFTPINERMCTLRIKIKFFNYPSSVYTPPQRIVKRYRKRNFIVYWKEPMIVPHPTILK